MREFSGLRLEPRCVRCNSLATTETVLYEMQNHRFICNTCSQKADAEGKQIAWANQAPPGSNSTSPVTPAAAANKPAPLGRAGEQPRRTIVPLKRNLPPDSIFAVLEIPLDTPYGQVREILRQQAKTWARKTSDPAYKTMNERLRKWQTELQDESAFEALRDEIRIQARGNIGALSVGGRPVMTAQEFRHACEERSEGWQDGIRYLRTGELWQWIHYHLSQDALSKEAQRYQKRKEISDFRALNEMLYCLDPTRPFRLYNQDAWQATPGLSSAATPIELATLCDLNWQIAERHLYAGSMVFWLERLQQVAGLHEYFARAVADYATDSASHNRGVGLELLLEYAVPSLIKPQLVVTFDNQVSGYLVSRWDREIPHKPVTLTVTNTTRGYVSAAIDMHQPNKPNAVSWLEFQSQQASSLAEGQALISQPITLYNLPSLKRGKTYQRKFVLSVRQAYDQPVLTQSFPMTLKTMNFYQGLRGKLWIFGLRGNVIGLLWHAIAAGLLALLSLNLIPLFLHIATVYVSPDTITAEMLLHTIGNGTLFALQFLGVRFVLITATLAGLAGFWSGLGKGHDDYTARRGIRTLLTWGIVTSLLVTIGLPFWDQTASFVSQNGLISSNAQLLALFFVLGASLILWLLISLILTLLAFGHASMECILRKRYASLLYPPGRA